jgi:3-oxoacyl-[acyl-carrier protein] reductase
MPEPRVVVVTGSSTGIGEDIARRFAREEGARVVLNSRTAARCEPVAESLRKEGYDAIAVPGDVRVKADVEKVVDEAVRRWGRVDVMVNNAGINRIAKSEDLTEEDYRLVLDTMLVGPLFGCQAAGRHMMAQDPKGGVIINISSLWGLTVYLYRAAYASAKHGLEGLTKVLAVEWAPHDIRVLTICPAFIKTEMDEGDSSSPVGGYTEADILRRTPMHRYGTLEEVSNAVLFAASPKASYLTGSPIIVDGGWMAYGGW